MDVVVERRKRENLPSYVGRVLAANGFLMPGGTVACVCAMCPENPSHQMVVQTASAQRIPRRKVLPPAKKALQLVGFKGRLEDIAAVSALAGPEPDAGTLRKAASDYATDVRNVIQLIRDVLDLHHLGEHADPREVGDAARRVVVLDEGKRSIAFQAETGAMIENLEGNKEQARLRNASRALRNRLLAEGVPFFGDQIENPAVMRLAADGDRAGAVATLGGLLADRVAERLAEAGITDGVALVAALDSNGPDALQSIRTAVPPALDDAAAGVIASAVMGVSMRPSAFLRLVTRAGRQLARRDLPISARAMQGLLLAEPAEFRRWVADGRIQAVVSPVGNGATHARLLFDSRQAPCLREGMPVWRAMDASRLSAVRKASKKRLHALNQTRRRQILFRACGLDQGQLAWPYGIAWIKVDPIVSAAPLALLVCLPPVVVDATLVPLPRGDSRTALEAMARDAVARIQMETSDAIAGAVATWRERVSSTADGVAYADRAGLETAAVIAAEAEFLVLPKEPSSGDDLARDVSSRLDKALATALTSWSRDRRREATRTASGMADYPSMFPAARAIRRRLILNVGPTNSGKTHAAMALLSAAGSGSYLAPLRLMALEAADRLGDAGIPADMVTGEEEILVAGARHVASTIEMTDLRTVRDVAVIDEIQMIADRHRGWAWTQAAVGVPAAVVVMTGSADAIPYVARIAAMTGDELEVVQFERKTPLEPSPVSVDVGDARPGDAFVAFSRRSVLDLKAALEQRGHVVASIYGGLGPEVRRTEAARFRCGEADVLVATDAIGMGLNLPIDRVILFETEKFDGIGRRALNGSEIRQIGGRAGRFGLSSGGTVAVGPGLEPGIVAQALRGTPSIRDDDRLSVMPPWEAVRAISEHLDIQDLRGILDYFGDVLIREDKRLQPSSLDSAKAVASFTQGSGLSLAERFHYCGCPVKTSGPAALRQLAKWARTHGEGKEVLVPERGRHGVTPRSGFRDAMASLEIDVERLSAYLWLARRFPHAYRDTATARKRRDAANGEIQGLLRHRLKAVEVRDEQTDPRWAALRQLVPAA